MYEIKTSQFFFRLPQLSDFESTLLFRRCSRLRAQTEIFAHDRLLSTFLRLHSNSNVANDKEDQRHRMTDEIDALPILPGVMRIFQNEANGHVVKHARTKKPRTCIVDIDAEAIGS